MKLFAQGKVLGVAEREKVNRDSGEVYYQYFLVLQSQKNGGLPGQTEDSEFRLTKRQVDAGLDKKLNDIRGKEVQIEVFPKSREYQKRVYTDWFIGGEGVPKAVPQAAPVQRAS